MKEIKVKLVYEITCPNCNGRGMTSDYDSLSGFNSTCADCRGQGTIREEVITPDSKLFMLESVVSTLSYKIKVLEEKLDNLACSQKKES